jgi:aminocarboxymuconate-semialdehyde decarboxylase
MSVPSVQERLAALGSGAIDFHTHAVDPDLVDLSAAFGDGFPSVRRIAPDRARILFAGRVYREVDSRCWSVPTRLRDMDAEGVAAQVVSPLPATLCHDRPAAGAALLATAQNDFLARMVEQAAGRLFALGVVPLQDSRLAVAELRRCVEELGFVGVEIGARVGDRELTDPALVPFFQAAAELGAVVFLHPVDRVLDPRLAALRVAFGIGMPTETATAAAGILVSDLLDHVPGLRLCLAHAGGTLPSALPRLAVGQRVVAGVSDPSALATERARGLWCDSLSYDAHALALAAHRFGEAHVVLGTDYPFDAREAPAGAVLAAAGELLTHAEDIARANSLALLAAVGCSPACSSDRGAPWHSSSASA